MRIILSPAKKMNVNTDDLAPCGLPVFMEQTEEIVHFLQGLSYGEAKKLWACNDGIAEQNYDRLQQMDLYHQLTPAILSYEGIAYQYMAPSVFENGQFAYVQEHLRILRCGEADGRRNAVPSGDAGKGKDRRDKGSV